MKAPRKDRFAKAIEETATFFAENLKHMSGSEGAAIRRNTERVKTVNEWIARLANGTADRWVASMEAETLAGRSSYDAELRDIAAYYVVHGKAVPRVLRRYTRKVLHGTFDGARRRKPGQRENDFHVRNLLIADRVNAVVAEYGLDPTRNSDSRKDSSSRRESASSVVAKALAANKLSMSEDSVQKIWGKVGRN